MKDENKTPPKRVPAIRTVTINGELVPYEDARVPITAPGLTFAVCVFEGIRAYWNEDQNQLFVFRLKEHLERLHFSAKMIQLDPLPPIDDLCKQAVETVKANEYRADTYIRPQAFVDEFGGMFAKGPVTTTIAAYPRSRMRDFHDGTKVCVSNWRRLSDNASPPRVKATANYLSSRLAGLDAQSKGFETAIILSESGKVSESTGACVFIVRDGILITPPVTAGILESITRDTMMIIARESGMTVVEREIDRTELYATDEAFLCGTGKEITPITQIDQFVVGDGAPGSITKTLQTAYDDLVCGRSKDHEDWITPVY